MKKKEEFKAKLKSGEITVDKDGKITDHAKEAEKAKKKKVVKKKAAKKKSK